ncbi:MAG: MATE family efflux transporter, partial [Lachnospiraceae bacterium]|nr:MATE family efflux transporter [Lachnospiraceae bacterium]
MKENVYKKVLTLSLPIALQNIFVTAVSSADVIMIGYVSQDALSAVSLAGQIQFVLNLIFLGLTLGTSLMCAQYWGRKDMVTIEKILGLVLKIALLIAFLFAVAACVFPDMLMRIFTNDEVLIGYGVTYLRIVGISYLFMSVSQVFQAVMKAVFQV